MTNFFRKLAQYTPVGIAYNVAHGQSIGNTRTGYTPPADYIQHSEQVPTNQLQFDPQTGYPVGQYGPPSARVALGYQYMADQATAQRRSAYFSSALGALQQGANVMASYRPGGAAALRSGLYQQQANLNYQIGTQQQSPDLLADYRRDAGAQAQEAANRAAERQTALGVVQAAAGIFGGLSGGARPSTLAPSPAAPGPITPAGQPPGIIPNYQSPTLASSLGPTGGGPGQALSSGLAPSGQPVQAPSRSGAASSVGGGGGPASGPGPSGPAGPPPGAGAAPAGGVGSDGNFSNTALAAHAMQESPHLALAVNEIHAATMDRGFFAAADAAADRYLAQAIMMSAA